MGLVVCPDCQKMISDRASICPQCGCDLEDDEPNPPSGLLVRWSNPAFGTALLVVAIVAFIVLMRLNDPTDPLRRRLNAIVNDNSPTFDTGDVGVLKSSGPTVLMARSDDYWDEMVDAENRKSAELMDRLADLHRVSRLSAGTRAVVVRVGNYGLYVRLLDGKDQGDEGWIHREAFEKRK